MQRDLFGAWIWQHQCVWAGTLSSVVLQGLVHVECCWVYHVLECCYFFLSLLCICQWLNKCQVPSRLLVPRTGLLGLILGRAEWGGSSCSASFCWLGDWRELPCCCHSVGEPSSYFILTAIQDNSVSRKSAFAVFFNQALSLESSNSVLVDSLSYSPWAQHIFLGTFWLCGAVLFPEHNRSEQGLLQYARQAASHGGKTCLKTEELLPMSFLPLLSVVGHRRMGKTIKALVGICVQIRM